MGSNLDRLKDAGLIVQDPLPHPYTDVPLPQPYIDVIESLSKEEVDTIVSMLQHDTIVSLTQRLEKAHAEPPWHVCFIPPF